MLPSVPTSLLLSWDEVGAFPPPALAALSQLPAPHPGGDSPPDPSYPLPIAAAGLPPFIAALAKQDCSQFKLQLSQPAGPFVFSLYYHLMLFCD